MTVVGAITALQKEMDIFPKQHRKSFPPHHCAQYSYTPPYMPGIRYLHGRVLQYRRQPDDLKQATEICT